ncbi:HAD family hydrolase [Falsihalocynthiibacter arcticus]|uniref:HAD family hydrolase n=1 Tax=Falsihalocynthiibacter arcticus TaxID=1579316 RepID=A0A126V055_9RHOB|nr:HAD family hydrolase [Falsihalocynthiibacter arcticus]AML51325.1 HAD family hydrolase [Falsihalocynthiibacter arcticus]
MRKISTIGFDADDTLWQNEAFFRLTQDKFAVLLQDFTQADHLAERLLAAERRNLGHYGFGVKGFILSMIETAIEVTDARVSAPIIQELLDAGQDMLKHPIHLLPHVESTLEMLAPDHKILLITKGDLLDQERKLAQSGLGEFFDGVEVLSDKNETSYRGVFARHNLNPNEVLMVGNSLKSDIIPVLATGARAVYVPHGMTWELEHATMPVASERLAEIPDLSHLGAALSAFNNS